MIRHATEEDIVQLKSLWNQSFHDPLNYVDFIYREVSRPADTFVYDIGGELASMMILIPTVFVFKDKGVKTMYIYGAATAQRHRQRGIMTAMLRHAEEYARDLDFALSIIVPGDKYLFDYYRRRGYSADFNCRMINIKPGMIKQDLKLEVDLSIDQISAKEFYDIREEALADTPHLRWNATQLEFIFEDLKIYGEHVAHYEGKLGRSYAVYGAGKKMHIKECFGSTREAQLAIIKDVIQANNPRHVTLCQPADSSLFAFEGSEKRYGMAKPLQSSASLKELRPYMNLMLD